MLPLPTASATYLTVACAKFRVVKPSGAKTAVSKTITPYCSVPNIESISGMEKNMIPAEARKESTFQMEFFTVRFNPVRAADWDASNFSLLSE